MGLWDAITESWEDACKDVEADDRRKRRLGNALKRGVVIRDSRFTYDHYGIYAGNRQVIHFTDGRVRKTSLAEFSENSTVDVMQFDNDKVERLSLEESYNRALSKVGKAGYNLFGDNCEHFALWCRTGEAFSSQAFGSRASSYSSASISGFFTNPIASYFGMDVSRSVETDKIRDSRTKQRNPSDKS